MEKTGIKRLPKVRYHIASMRSLILWIRKFLALSVCLLPFHATTIEPIKAKPGMEIVYRGIVIY